MPPVAVAAEAAAFICAISALMQSWETFGLSDISKSLRNIVDVIRAWSLLGYSNLELT